MHDFQVGRNSRKEHSPCYGAPCGVGHHLAPNPSPEIVCNTF